MTARAAPYFPKTLGTADGTITDFTVGFPFLHPDHLRIFDDGALQVKDTDYVVLDATSPTAAVVRFLTAPTTAHVITAQRNTPITRYKGNPQIGNVDALQAQYRMQEAMDQRITLRDSYGQTALLAGTALSFVAPCDGYIEKLRGKVLKAVTTGGAVTVEIDTVAITGLTFTVADADAAGTTYSDVPTTAQSTTTKVKKGQTITITPAAAFATAGDLEVAVELQPADLT